MTDMREKEQEERERRRREDLARLSSLRPIDDDFMRCLFKDNIPLAQLVLRIITQKDDLEVISLETQRDMKRLVGARSICLDAYAEDSQGKKYDLEIQRADSGACVQRARYHSGAMDVENLDAGQDFSELPDTYTIFITENDVFSRGKALYRVERYNIDADEFFNDGEHIIYVNGGFRDDSDIGRLMHDFCCTDPNDMYYKQFRDTSRYLKTSQEGVNAMCKVFEEIRDEGIAIGIQQGLQQGMQQGREEMKLDFAKKLLRHGKLTLEEIAQMTGLSLGDVRKLQETGA